MEKLDNIKYELINYNIYKDRIHALLRDEELVPLGIKYQSIGKSEFGFDIDLITLGNGKKHLFIVGGTHGSEIIGVDYVTQLIHETKNMPFFDPNEFTLYFIPLQNPEGFIITTNALKEINNKFNEASYEYYLRYRTDDLINQALIIINEFITNNKNKDANIFLQELKRLLKSHNIFKRITESRAIPEFKNFILAIDLLEDTDYHDLCRHIASISSNIINDKKDSNDIHSIFLIYLMDIFKEYFTKENLNNQIVNHKLRLHQQQFSNNYLNPEEYKKLYNNIIRIYDDYNHPAGSQVTFDATGLGINLNANNRFNPGIEIAKNDITRYRLGARNNIRNYVPGPVGTSCYDPNNFEYAKENIALYRLIKRSYDRGNYIGTLLYHGTGGMIFYKPNMEMTDDKEYDRFLQENETISSIYSEITGYRLIKEESFTGYGDLLRSQFPGVLMIELSKMGGNPISPYGDINNIRNCFYDNFDSFNNLLYYYHNLSSPNKIRMGK